MQEFLILDLEIGECEICFIDCNVNIIIVNILHSFRVIGFLCPFKINQRFPLKLQQHHAEHTEINEKSIIQGALFFRPGTPVSIINKRAYFLN